MTRNEPLWIRGDVVLAIHLGQIAEHGGLDGVRDKALLESALAKPKNLFLYGNPLPSTADMAASYAYGIVKNHPFLDGNKRTAFVVMMLFLKINGVSLDATQEQKYQTFIALAEGGISEKQLSEWITKKSSF